jgi:hypothetical protein
LIFPAYRQAGLVTFFYQEKKVTNNIIINIFSTTNINKIEIVGQRPTTVECTYAK